jgi:hypothetical protein
VCLWLGLVGGWGERQCPQGSELPAWAQPFQLRPGLALLSLPGPLGTSHFVTLPQGQVSPSSTSPAETSPCLGPKGRPCPCPYQHSEIWEAVGLGTPGVPGLQGAGHGCPATHPVTPTRDAAAEGQWPWARERVWEVQATCPHIQPQTSGLACVSS